MTPFPKLAFTCPMKWDEMRGDERQRFCAKCNCHVVNLSVLTEAQRVALLAASRDERLCVAYRQRLSRPTDGSPRPARAAKFPTLVRWGAAAAFAGVLAAVASHTSTDREGAAKVHHALTNTYYSARFKMERWIDDVRVYFGGTPRYSTITLGVICEPSAPIAVPSPTPAPSSVPERGEATPTGNPG